MARVSDRRRQLGALGERKACEHLAALGYEVLDRNFRTRYGEIDVVASDGRALVICEVKTRVASGTPSGSGTRSGPFGPLSAVGPRKRRQLRRMAAQWLHGRAGRRAGGDSLRFDAIGVTVSQTGVLLELEHLKDAF